MIEDIEPGRKQDSANSKLDALVLRSVNQLLQRVMLAHALLVKESCTHQFRRLAALPTGRPGRRQLHVQGLEAGGRPLLDRQRRQGKRVFVNKPRFIHCCCCCRFQADPSLLVPYPSGGMVCWPVSQRVGSVKNNDPSLIEPIVLT